jgi:hypothetical protein
MANGMTICVFSDAAIAPVLSSIEKFRDEYRYHVENKRCLVGPKANERPRSAAERDGANGSLSLSPANGRHQ